MKRRIGRILILAAGVLAGCATPKLDCSGRWTECREGLATCDPIPEICAGLTPGASYALVFIDTSPTPAAIHVDGRYIGETPLRHPLEYTSQTRYINVVARPIYPNQARQERRLRVPPLPDSIKFFMSNPPQDSQDEDKRNRARGRSTPAEISDSKEL